MTLSELYDAALQEIGVLAHGESASADDRLKVESLYAGLYDMLLTEGLVAWAATASVPEYAEIPLSQMLGALCVGPFGVTGPRAQQALLIGGLYMTPQSIAERTLRRQLAKQYVSHPARPEYF